MVLPGRLDGIDLARVASLRWPWIRVVVTSGWARVKDLPQNVVFLPKPWRATDLHAQLEWGKQDLGRHPPYSSACLRGRRRQRNSRVVKGLDRPVRPCKDSQSSGRQPAHFSDQNFQRVGLLQKPSHSELVKV